MMDENDKDGQDPVPAAVSEPSVSVRLGTGLSSQEMKLLNDVEQARVLRALWFHCVTLETVGTFKQVALEKIRKVKQGDESLKSRPQTSL